MAQLLVRDIKPETINRLKDRAKQHNRSLQGEAKLILEEAAQKMTMEEFKARAQKWHKRLAGRKFGDS
ncbi:MAG TPA: hypothetical protein VMU21_02345, partial [Thermodesulfovibrionales bacterium]|nr:hypothetical protein [Thermodesulfovibrionales bacterium]